MGKKLHKINYEEVAMWIIVATIAVVGLALIWHEATHNYWN